MADKTGADKDGAPAAMAVVANCLIKPGLAMISPLIPTADIQWSTWWTALTRTHFVPVGGTRKSGSEANSKTEGYGLIAVV